MSLSTFICVICGDGSAEDSSSRGESLNDGVIKKEVEAVEPRTDDLEGADIDLTGSINEVLLQHPRPEDEVHEYRWTEEEKEIYQWFLHWFSIRLVRKERPSRKLVNYGWDGDSGRDAFPFCGTCKCQLMELLEIQRKVNELEATIQKRVEGLKGKAISCEECFGGKGFYERDRRFKRVRREIVPDFRSRYPPETKGGHLIEQRMGKPKSKRKSVRNKELSSQSKYGSFTFDPVRSSETYPAFENFNVDGDLINVDIKPEVSEESCTDIGAHIDENEGSQLTHPDSKKMKRKRGTEKEKSHRHSTTPKHQKLTDGPVEYPFFNDDFEPLENSRDDELDSFSVNPPRARKQHSRKRKNTQSEVDDPTSSSHPPAEPKKRRRSKIKVLAEEDDHYEPPPSPPTPPPFGKGKRKFREKDVDWTLDGEESEKIVEEESSNDEDYAEESEEYDSETGKRKHTRAKLDPVKRTLTYKRLVFHQLEPYSENIFECSKCMMQVKHNGHSIRYHYFRSHSTLYSCKQCEYRADSKGHLKGHIARAHEGAPCPRGRPANCRICGKPTIAGRLKVHEWSHKNQEERQAAIASRASDVPYFEVKKHQCEECGRQFSSAAILRRHQEIKHGDQEELKSKMELCPECGGVFLDLRSHMRSKHQVQKLKKYTCLEPDCGKVFRGLSQLTKHKNAVHRKIRPYKCTMCPREFSHPKIFQNHVNLHNGIRPFQCEHCPMGFTTKSNWQRHTAIYHTPGVTPPKRKPFVRGPTMLSMDVKKSDLINQGKYLPPSALATWAAGREPTSHFPVGMGPAGGSGDGTNDATESESLPLSLLHHKF